MGLGEPGRCGLPGCPCGLDPETVAPVNRVIDEVERATKAAQPPKDWKTDPMVRVLSKIMGQLHGLRPDELLRRADVCFDFIEAFKGATSPEKFRDDEDFNDLIADLKNVLTVYAQPRPPKRVETVSSPQEGGEA